MTLFEAINQINQLEITKQLDFCERLNHNLTVAIRSIWDDDELTSQEMVESIKWINEFVHQLYHIKIAINQKPNSESILMMYENAKFYAAQNEITKNNLGFALKSSFEQIMYVIDKQYADNELFIENKELIESIFINEKIEVDLEAFIKTGQFDYVKLGMSREELVRILPFPDDYGTENQLERASIWRYGNFDFFFDAFGALDKIFNDNLNDLDGGKTFHLKKWIFENPENLTLEFVLNSFNTLNMDYEKQSNSINQITIKVIRSGVKLVFEDVYQQNINPNLIKLVAIIKN